MDADAFQPAQVLGNALQYQQHEQQHQLLASKAPQQQQQNASWTHRFPQQLDPAASTVVAHTHQHPIASSRMAQETLQQKLRRQLLADAAAGTAAFECSGEIALERPLKLFFEDGAGTPRTVTFPLESPADLQPLLDACAPAAFGVGSRTVRDLEVRNALQMPGSRLALGGGGGVQIPPASLLAGVQQLMMPQGQPGSVEPELYALNIYAPDGFFKAHRDTPRGTGMFGSLVVCLPVEHSGGTLVVRSPTMRSEVRHDWGGGSLLQGGAAGRLAWAALYADCEHEVLPVTSGHRVTLTYNLFTRATQDSEAAPAGPEAAAAAAVAAALPAAAPQPQASAFGQQLTAALHDATWYPGGITLGLVLEHMYAVSKPRTAMPSAPITPAQLKGGDLQLWATARALGLRARIVAVYKLSTFEDYGEEPLGPHADLVFGPFKEAKPPQREEDMYGDMMMMMGGGFGGFGEDPEDTVWFMDGEEEQEFLGRMRGTTHDKRGEKVVWVKPPGEQHRVYRDQASAYGNEGHTQSWYAAAAMLIDIPTADAPVRQQPQQQPQQQQQQA